MKTFKLRIGLYNIELNLYKEKRKVPSVVDIALKELKLCDARRKTNQRLKASSKEYALKYERLLNNVATIITREPGSAFKTRTIIEKEIKPQEVYNKMEELLVNNDTPLEDRRGLQI